MFHLKKFIAFYLVCLRGRDQLEAIHVGPGDQTQVVKPDGWRLYPLSFLESPCFIFSNTFDAVLSLPF